MTWKTFGGAISEQLTAIVKLRAEKDGINLQSDAALADYFRAHLERGISNIQNAKNISTLLLERGY